MKLSKLMESYFDDGRVLLQEARPKSISTNPREMPIKPKQEKNWTPVSNPSRLIKIFKIQNEEKSNNFIIDVLEMQSEMSHHGRISIQYPKIKMEIWTHTLMDVTELDIEWCSKVDNIFKGYKK